jgi:hypothetical protein
MLAAVPALALMLAVSLSGTVPARLRPAFAADCSPDDTGTLVIRIVDIATGDLLPYGGTEVLIDPDPRDFDLDYLVTDSDIEDAGALQDTDQDAGVIRFDGACSTSSGEAYEASIHSLATGLEDCAVAAYSDTAELDKDETAELELEVDCTALWASTQTPSPTTTVAPSAVPSSVLVTLSASSVACGDAALVVVAVRDEAGNPVSGAPVAVAASIGSITPATGHTTGPNGVASMTFIAPMGVGGTATVGASSGAAGGSAQIAVACITEVLSSGGEANAAPAASGTSVIRPPSTGSAGLVVAR